MEEYKIGTKLLRYGATIKVVDNTARQFNCRDCYFYSPAYGTIECMCAFNCSPLHRIDGNRIIYKEIK